MPRPLRAAPFRSVWLAGVVSDAGDWLLLIALPLVVYNLTGSAFGTSIALLVELVPGIVLAPLAGWGVDRWDRRRVMVLVLLAQGLSLLPLLIVHARSDLPVVYVVIIVEASLLALFDPAKNALLPTLVDTEDLVAANSLIGLGQNLSRLVGGPIGGALLAVGGLTSIAVVDLATYVLAALLLATVSLSPRVDPEVIEPAPVGPYRFAAQNRPVRTAFLVTFIAQVAQGIFVVLFILFVVRQLHGGDSEVGLYRGVQAVGAVAGALALTALSRRWSASSLIAPSLLVFGLLDLGLWDLSYLTTTPAIYVLLFIVVGAPGLLLVTGIVSSLQQETPDGQLGRVFSCFGLVGNAGQIIGILLAGVLAERIGLMVLLNAQGAIYLLAAILAVGTFSPSRRVRAVPAVAG